MVIFMLDRGSGVEGRIRRGRRISRKPRGHSGMISMIRLDQLVSRSTSIARRVQQK
jgi:hypothetical protein